MNKDTWWIIFVLLVVGVAWVLQNRGGFLQIAPPDFAPPVETPAPGEKPGFLGDSKPGFKKDAEKPKELKIRISAVAALASKVEEEYITLELENIDFESKEKVNISGLTLKNKNNHSAAIGNDESGANIFLGGGERAIIVTGVSTRGVNFKLNKCSGYFNQSWSFAPSISFFCPRISDLPQTRNLKERCIDYLETLPMCQRIDPGLESGDFECSEFMAKHASYAGCVADHKNDKDFDKKEWRIYLGRESELWGNRHDDIKLFDQNGNLIAETSY